MMNRLLLLVCLSGFSVSAMATCEEMKAQITAKLEAKGIKEYTLEIRPIQNTKNDSVSPGKETPKKKEGKVIGTCDDDRKEIIYKRL
jgi:hypothetical protein